MSSPRPPLATFYILVTTQTLSLICSRMTSIGIGVWVFAQTGLTGLSFFARRRSLLYFVLNLTLVNFLLNPGNARNPLSDHREILDF